MKLNNKIITEELEEVAPMLAKLDKVNFYEVDGAYFQNAQATIIESVQKLPVDAGFLSTALTLVNKKELYMAPAATYFESFSDDMIRKVHAEEVAEELSYALPLLQHTEKKALYEVPGVYFLSFPGSVSALISKQGIEHNGPVREWGHKWNELAQRIFGLVSRPKYAFVMASVVSIVVCSVLVFSKQPMSEEDKIFAQMQQIPDADIHNYISGHRDEFDERTLLLNINNVEFTHYFDKPEQVTPHIESHVKGNAADDEISKDDILD